MFDKLYMQILKKSPWGDFDDEEDKRVNNIFTKPRRGSPFNFQDLYGKFGFNNNLVILILVLLVGAWFATGIYEVKEGEEAAVTRFGKFVRKGFPGLNYRLPSPIEQEIIEKVNQSRRIEIGYRSTSSYKSNVENARPVVAESTMLTGDENIVALNCDVMWHINDLEKFIFNIVSPEESVKTAAESAIREVIGNTPISSILSDQKQEITSCL